GVPEVLGGHFPKVEPVQLLSPEKHAAGVKALIDASAKEWEKAKVELQIARKTSPDAPALKALETVAAVKAAAHDALVKTLAAEKLEEDGKLNSDAWKKAATEALEA